MTTAVENIVDQLGFIKAQIAALTEEENTLKEKLVARGVDSYEGVLFRATVSEYEKANLDMAAVRRKLDPKWIKAHTTYVDVVQVRVVARTGAEITSAKMREIVENLST